MREKNPQISNSQRQNHLFQLCLFLSLHFMPQKKDYTCNDFVPGKGGHKLLEWSQQLGFTFPETYIDLIILYSTNLIYYIHIKLDDLVQIAENIWFTLLLSVERKQIFEPIFEIVFLWEVCNSITAAFLKCSTSTDCREEEKEICLKLLFGDSIPLQSSGKSWEMRSEHVDLWTCGPAQFWQSGN